MSETEGFMRCIGCGMIWKGRWETDQEVVCPECQSPLEEVDEEDLEEQ